MCGKHGAAFVIGRAWLLLTPPYISDDVTFCPIVHEMSPISSWTHDGTEYPTEDACREAMATMPGFGDPAEMMPPWPYRCPRTLRTLRRCVPAETFAAAVRGRTVGEPSPSR